MKILAPDVLTSDDLCQLVKEATGKPCSHSRLNYLILTGQLPRPAARFGVSRIWFESQLAPLDAPPKRIL